MSSSFGISSMRSIQLQSHVSDHTSSCCEETLHHSSRLQAFIDHLRIRLALNIHHKVCYTICHFEFKTLQGELMEKHEQKGLFIPPRFLKGDDSEISFDDVIKDISTQNLCIEGEIGTGKTHFSKY